MFGLSANGVSALAVRAREGLRQAYLAEHVGANIPAACKAYAEALSADTRGRLSRRRQAAVGMIGRDPLGCRHHARGRGQHLQAAAAVAVPLAARPVLIDRHVPELGT